MIPSGRLVTKTGAIAVSPKSNLQIPVCAGDPHIPSNSRLFPSSEISAPRLGISGYEYSCAWLLTALPYKPPFHNELTSPGWAGAEKTIHSGVSVAVGEGVGDGRVAVLVGLGDTVGVKVMVGVSVTVAVMVVVAVSVVVFAGSVLVLVGVRER